MAALVGCSVLSDAGRRSHLADAARMDVASVRESCSHLETCLKRDKPPNPPQRSIRELQEAAATDPDPEFRDAISENIVAIARKKAQVEALDEEIARSRGDLPSPSVAPAASLPVPGGPPPPQLPPEVFEFIPARSSRQPAPVARPQEQEHAQEQGQEQAQPMHDAAAAPGLYL